jgi:hypothetical protein
MTEKEFPTLAAHKFSCPRCGAIAHQDWFRGLLDSYGSDEHPMRPNDYLLTLNPRMDQALIYEFQLLAQGVLIPENADNPGGLQTLHNLNISQCFSCKKYSIWVGDKLIFPSVEYSRDPHSDMPEDVKCDFLEASSIFALSPRGAAALLRLGLQKLMKHVGEKGKKIDDDIKSLVSKGLDVRIQKALDVVRVIGNEAVHPGQIDLNDDRETAEALFKLLNVIVERLISTPNQIEKLYGSLPEDKRKAIEKRDAKI